MRVNSTAFLFSISDHAHIKKYLAHNKQYLLKVGAITSKVVSLRVSREKPPSQASGAGRLRKVLSVGMRPPKKPVKRAEDKPKVTAYTLWAMREREKMQEEDMEMNPKQVVKYLMELWKELSNHEKDELRAEAAKQNGNSA